MFWYHEKTKHTYLSVRRDPHSLDWEKKPDTYKIYPGALPRRVLDKHNAEDRFLYHIAGLTLKKRYPGGEYYLRINPSAGALYPNELYFQVRGIEGMTDGIYHYEVYSNSIVLLREITEDEGLEIYFGFKKSMCGYLFLLSAICERSVWKYRDRAFRYCLLDAGHLLGSIEASALLKPHATQMIYKIDRERLGTIFGFGRGEFFVAGASVAIPLRGQDTIVKAPMSLVAETTGERGASSLIEKAYRESSIMDRCKKEIRPSKFSYDADRLEESIVARRSQRGFGGEAITKGQFNYIMNVMEEPILSDCNEEITIHAVVNRVIDMPLGLYQNGLYQKYGDFSRKAGYLCLEQYSLAEQSAVTFFLSSRGANYQALYQKAGIIGHRLYIAAGYLGLGCSGIGAYYDDEVTLFLEHEGVMLYVLAIGR